MKTKVVASKSLTLSNLAERSFGLACVNPSTTCVVCVHWAVVRQDIPYRRVLTIRSNMWLLWLDALIICNLWLPVAGACVQSLRGGEYHGFVVKNVRLKCGAGRRIRRPVCLLVLIDGSTLWLWRSYRDPDGCIVLSLFVGSGADWLSLIAGISR